MSLADVLHIVAAHPNRPLAFGTESITEPGRDLLLSVSFDVGAHAVGWWANADYDRCFHIGVSFPGEGTELVKVPAALGGGLRERRKLETPTDAEVWAVAVKAWGEANARLTWTEPAAPPGDPYRLPNVVHVRLFVDEYMRPFMPLGEVYHLRPTGQSPAKIIDGRLGADVR